MYYIFLWAIFPIFLFASDAAVAQARESISAGYRNVAPNLMWSSLGIVRATHGQKPTFQWDDDNSGLRGRVKYVEQFSQNGNTSELENQYTLTFMGANQVASVVMHKASQPTLIRLSYEKNRLVRQWTDSGFSVDYKYSRPDGCLFEILTNYEKPLEGGVLGSIEMYSCSIKGSVVRRSSVLDQNIWSEYSLGEGDLLGFTQVFTSFDPKNSGNVVKVVSINRRYDSGVNAYVSDERTDDGVVRVKWWDKKSGFLLGENVSSFGVKIYSYKSIDALGNWLARDIEWTQRNGQKIINHEKRRISYYAQGEKDRMDMESSAEIKALIDKAQVGDVLAQRQLAQAYVKGVGVMPDKKLALYWYSRAASQGDLESQYRLGNAYSDGSFVPQSDVDAEKWYLAAAQRGHIEAQYSLGIFYGYSKGAKDLVKSVMWCSIAAEYGNAEAEGSIESLKKRLSLDDFNRGREMARNWLQNRGR